MDREEMYNLFEQGYVFYEHEVFYGYTNELDLGDLELINITRYTIKSKIVVVYEWTWIER